MSLPSGSRSLRLNGDSDGVIVPPGFTPVLVTVDELSHVPDRAHLPGAPALMPFWGREPRLLLFGIQLIGQFLAAGVGEQAISRRLDLFFQKAKGIY